MAKVAAKKKLSGERRVFEPGRESRGLDPSLRVGA